MEVLLAESVRFVALCSLVKRPEILHNRGMERMVNQQGSPGTGKPKRLAFLILPEVQILDLAGPVQVFDTAARLGAPYTLLFCGPEPEVESWQHLHLARLAPLPEPEEIDMLLVAGLGGVEAHPENLLTATTLNWLQKCAQRGVSIASVCTGAAVLGEAGLLHRKRCTTHWAFVAELQRRYPTAQVLDNVLYVQDHGITTSAGVASGIDMALWLLEQDYGPRMVATVAHRLVIYLRRNGLHQQRSIYLEYRAHLDSCVHRVQDWLAAHASEAVSMAELAAVGETSVRSLARAFKAATGITPREYQQLLRLELAANLLNNSRLSLEAIAARTGFGDPRHFRRIWSQHFGMPPSAGRQRASPARMFDMDG